MTHKHPIKTIVTFAVEGSTEKAFLDHLKIIKGRSASHRIVNIYAAGGGSGPTVISKVVINRGDENFAWMDFDRLEADPREHRKVLNDAKKHKIEVNYSNPKVEAFLLEILGVSYSSSTNLDSLLDPYLGPRGKTVRESYAKHFDISTLESRRSSIDLLDWLMRILEL